MKRLFIIILFLLITTLLQSQNTKRVLFLGNSYTYVNNLPQLITDAAASTGKTLIHDMNAPGGYYIGQHLTNPESLAKIQAGNWDNVVLQDQSMALAYPGYALAGLPSSQQIDAIIKANNTCAQTMFYATWGRKNGDTYICTPPYCSTTTTINRNFFQMTTDIQNNYKLFADDLEASMSPVGAVWAQIRQHHPSIELFDPDESHPSLAGSYAAACCFYATIFRSDPNQITYNAGLSDLDASNIRQAAKQIVYDNLLQWNVGAYDHLLGPSCLALGVNEATSNTLHWNASPNPVTDFLSVRFSTTITNEKLIIYNNIGQLVKEIETNGTTTLSIDLSSFSNGLYFIKSTATEKGFKVLKK